MTLVLNGTTGVSSVDGSASTPAIQGNDTNTGVFFPAADTVAIATGGSERLRADSSGNVGIGVTPTVSAGVTELALGSASTNPRINGVRDGAAAMLLTSDSVGTSFYERRNLPLLLGTNNTERARIDSSGNLLVGTTSQVQGAERVAIVNSTVPLSVNRTGSDGVAISMHRSGTTVGSISVTASATAYNTSSDYRLKEQVQPMTGALATVSALKPVTYKWKSDGSDGQGFIAHELQAVAPDCVTGEKDAVDAEGNPVYQGIDTSFLVATLTAAIQEQQALIESLTARIAAIEGAKA